MVPPLAYPPDGEVSPTCFWNLVPRTHLWGRRSCYQGLFRCQHPCCWGWWWASLLWPWAQVRRSQLGGQQRKRWWLWWAKEAREKMWRTASWLHGECELGFNGRIRQGEHRRRCRCVECEVHGFRWSAVREPYASRSAFEAGWNVDAEDRVGVVDVVTSSECVVSGYLSIARILEPWCWVQRRVWVLSIIGRCFGRHLLLVSEKWENGRNVERKRKKEKRWEHICSS